MMRGTTKHLLGLLVAASCACACVAYWAIPYKLAYGQNGSFYTFGYLSGEYDDAQRLQPLMPGATAFSTINGEQDPALLSPFYLEDALRPVLAALHVNVIAFVWAWRLAFPVGLLVLLMLLARECLPRSYGLLVPAAAAAVALPVIACISELFATVRAEHFTPLLGALNRVPNNVEYLLSAALALAFVRFIKRASMTCGIAVAALFAATVYLRPNLALMWAPAVGLVTLGLVAAGRIRVSTALASLGLAAVLLAPFCVVAHLNHRSPVYAEFLQRCYVDGSGQSTAQRMFYGGAAIALLLSAIFVATRYRMLLIVAGISMATWPFANGLFSFPCDATGYENLGAFYWIGLTLAGLLVLGAGAAGLRVKAGAIVLPLALFALAGGAALGYHNASHNFLANPDSPYRNIVIDQAYVPAYTWVREHVDADATFVVDDGYEWSLAYDGSHSLTVIAPDETSMLSKADLFQLIARRKRVFNEHALFEGLSDFRFTELMLVQRGTLGFPIGINEYDRALLNTWPTHILWRKLPLNPTPVAPLPRGFGTQLRNFSNVIYEDNVCEIWELNYAQISPIYRAPAHPLPSVRRTEPETPRRMFW